MSDTNARVAISGMGLTFEASGSETFVSQQVAAFKDLLTQSPASAGGGDKGAASGAGEKVNAASAKPKLAIPSNIEQFPNVFHREGDDVRLLIAPPGGSSAEKSLNIAVLYIWAKNQIGVPSVNWGEIRNLCEHFNCLDSPNFGKLMQKRNNGWLVVEGEKQSKSKMCKLTHPGAVRAAALAAELNGQAAS